MSRERLARLREIVVTRLGYLVDEGRESDLAEALARRLAARGRPNETTYMAALERDDTELRELGELLTVGETCFFRTREHFEVLGDVLASRPRSRGSDLRILSAGCSSGEEAYSIAIALREREEECRPASWLRWHVDAVDLNRRSLAKAKAGIYSPWSLREMPDDVRERWFKPRGREHELDREIRGSVDFREQSLLDASIPLARHGVFDVVFCRNVLMYFTPEATRAIVQRLTDALAPGGVLFLGHAESMRGVSSEYALESSHGTFYYRRLPSPVVTLPVRPRKENVFVPPFVPPPVAPAVVAAPAVPVAGSSELDHVLELVSLERFDQALERLSLLSSFEQEEASATILRAVVQLGTGDVEAAAMACSRLLEAGGACVEAHVVLALVAEHHGDLASAIAQHRAALYLEPDFALSHLHLGRLERREGRTKEARHELGQALELLEHEKPSRLLLFGGGFSRAGLLALCRTELATLGGVR